MNRTSIVALIAFLSCSTSMAGPLLDPTRPANAPRHEKVDAAVRVQAIVISDNDTWAIVNDTVVHQGDRIGNIIIESIERHQVRYSRSGHSGVALLPHSTLQVRRDAASHEDTP